MLAEDVISAAVATLQPKIQRISVTARIDTDVGNFFA